jgi:hypothetical protein
MSIGSTDFKELSWAGLVVGQASSLSAVVIVNSAAVPSRITTCSKKADIFCGGRLFPEHQLYHDTSIEREFILLPCVEMSCLYLTGNKNNSHFSEPYFIRLSQKNAVFFVLIFF